MEKGIRLRETRRQQLVLCLVLFALAVGIPRLLSSEGNPDGANCTGPKTIQEPELEQESLSTERRVLEALDKLLQGTTTKSDVDICRDTLFSGLGLMDWEAYEVLSEACKKTEAISRLFRWIEAQTSYTYDEILSLQLVHTSNLGEAYTDIYAQVLCDVFLKEPAIFLACLDHSPDDERGSESVVYMTISAAKATEKDDRIRRLTKDLIDSKNLSEGAVIWAGLMHESLCAFTQVAEPTKKTTSIPVLLYHHLLPRAEIIDNRNGMIVPLEEFQLQMAWLKEKGYKTPTLTQFRAWLKGEIELSENSVLITFDDNYHSVKDYALPILEENGLTAVSFVIGTCSDGSEAETNHVNWGDMVSLHDTKIIDFQSHTYDGHTETLGEPDILSWSHEQFNHDLERLENCFEDHGLTKPRVFAYPYGAVNHVLTDVLALRDYQLAFTTKHGLVAQGDDPFRLKRIIIWPGTTLEQFQARMGYQQE